jgi:hypothetical protein
MAAFELPLVALLSTVLTRLTLLGRREGPPAWTEIFACGAVAWIVGTQGLLFRRQPDYMVAYLFEARGASGAVYVAWCAAALGLAWGFSIWARGARPRDLGLVFGAALGIGLLALPMAGRLHFVGSTFEFREGVPRPLDYEPTVQTLLTLTSIASFVPVLGAALAVAADGLRSVLRGPPA